MGWPFWKIPAACVGVLAILIAVWTTPILAPTKNHTHHSIRYSFIPIPVSAEDRPSVGAFQQGTRTMTDKKTGVDIEFNELTPSQQEAYIPRGEYLNPEMLDQGNAPKGAPTGPIAADDDSLGEPNPATVDPNDEPAPAAKRGGKRT